MSAPLRTRVRSWRRAPLRAALRAVRAWRGDRTVAALAVVAVLTLVCLAGLGVRWWAMSGSAEAQVAAARDTALEHGTQALEVLNAIDHRTAGSDVDRWLQVTDGSLHQQLKGDRDEHVARAEDQEMVATATTSRAALSDLDEARGTARLLAVVKVQVHGGPDGGGEGGQPESRRSGVLADLTRDGDTWKVSAVQEAGS